MRKNLKNWANSLSFYSKLHTSHYVFFKFLQ